MNRKLFIGGAHRGATAVTNEAVRFLPIQQTYTDIVIADPKEQRAVDLARVWNENGISAEGKRESCERAIEEIEPDAVLLAIDTIKPMANVLEKSAKSAQFQLLCRGMGENGPVIGISGSLHEGESIDRSSSVKLIRELGSFVQPQSSSAIRQDHPLNADFLHTMRLKVSKHSAERLPLLDREPGDLKKGPLNLFWGSAYYPLLIQEKAKSQRWKETKEQALTAELPPYLKSMPYYAIALVGTKNIDLFVIEETWGRRVVGFHMPLLHALPANRSRRTVTRVMTGEAPEPSFFELLLAAAVTD